MKNGAARSASPSRFFNAAWLPRHDFQSLRRRRERLEDRLREEKLLRRGAAASDRLSQSPDLEEEDIDDLEDAPEEELETAEEQIVDQATAALTIAELEEEIRTLRALESEAAKLKRSGNDTKWKELSKTIPSRKCSMPAAIGASS